MIKYFSLVLLMFAGYSLFALKTEGKINLPPVKTFYESCAKCHGLEGESFKSGLKKLNDYDLYKISEEMMYGPSFLTPGEADVYAMTSYMKSLAYDLPFIAAEKTADDKLRIIELSEGTIAIVADSVYNSENLSGLNDALHKSDTYEVLIKKGSNEVKIDLNENRLYPQIKTGSIN